MTRYVVVWFLTLIIVSCNSREQHSPNVDKSHIKDTLSFDTVMDDLEKYGFFNSEFYDADNKKINEIVHDTFTMKIQFRGKYCKMLNDSHIDAYSRTNNLILLKKVSDREYQFYVDTNRGEKDFRFEIILKPKNCLFKKRTTTKDVYEYTKTMGFFRIVNLY